MGRGDGHGEGGTGYRCYAVHEVTHVQRRGPGTTTLTMAILHAGWTNATQLWVRNPDGPRKPFAVAYCANTTDVQTVLRACAAAHLCVSVRSSGHNFLAWSELSNRVVVDVSRINSTRLVQPGLVAAGPGTNLEMINSFTEAQVRQ